MYTNLDWDNIDYESERQIALSEADDIDYPEASSSSSSPGSTSEEEEFSDLETKQIRRCLESMRRRRHKVRVVVPRTHPEAICPICLFSVNKTGTGVFCIASCGTIYHHGCWMEMIRWDSRCSICRFPGRCKFLTETSIASL